MADCPLTDTHRRAIANSLFELNAVQREIEVLDATGKLDPDLRDRLEHAKQVLTTLQKTYFSRSQE